MQDSLIYRLMTETRLTVVRLTIDGDKFEILVKPDPALEYKLGKRTDLSSVLIADEIYSDANKGSRAASEKLTKHFKTTDPTEISAQSYSVFKTIGNFKGEHWLEDGSLRVILEINAGMKGSFLDRLGSITKGSAQVLEA